MCSLCQPWADGSERNREAGPSFRALGMGMNNNMDQNGDQEKCPGKLLKGSQTLALSLWSCF